MLWKNRRVEAIAKKAEVYIESVYALWRRDSIRYSVDDEYEESTPVSPDEAADISKPETTAKPDTSGDIEKPVEAEKPSIEKEASHTEGHVQYSEREYSKPQYSMREYSKEDDDLRQTLRAIINSSSEASTRDLDRHLAPTFVDTLLEHIDKNHLRDSQVYKAAGIDRRLFSKIVSDRTYKPARDTCIALCFGLRLNIADASELLERAGYTLSHSSKRDMRC